MSQAPGFKTPEGKAAYLAAYEAELKLWPVPYEDIELPSRFGTTHVIACGPADAPPLVLLHGYMATSTMWWPNVADFSREHRVYAIDVMGQASRSIPADPIGSAADYVAWLNTTLYGLHVNRFSLIGMSFGGWLALHYAIAMPARVEKLVLLSPGGFLPMVRQFMLRGMSMAFFPARFTVRSFMRWLGFTIGPGSDFELMYLGMKHFRFAPATLRVLPTAFSHGELSTVTVPTLLLFGTNEVIYDPVKALERARRLIPDLESELVPDASHDMCFTKHE